MIDKEILLLITTNANQLKTNDNTIVDRFFYTEVYAF